MCTRLRMRVCVVIAAHMDITFFTFEFCLFDRIWFFFDETKRFSGKLSTLFSSFYLFVLIYVCGASSSSWCDCRNAKTSLCFFRQHTHHRIVFEIFLCAVFVFSSSRIRLTSQHKINTSFETFWFLKNYSNMKLKRFRFVCFRLFHFLIFLFPCFLIFISYFFFFYFVVFIRFVYLSPH